MNKLFSIGLAGVAAAVLLAGCQKEDTETKKQLAQLQAQLDAEKAEKAQHEAQERAKQQEQEQQAREEQIRLEAEESVKAQLKMEAEAKQAAAKTVQQKAAAPKFTEKVVRYPATVVTQSGYGDLSLRGEPSTKGIEISKVYDGDEVTVIAKTNKCEVIGNVEGCWVKVKLDNAKGYMFDGYLNREVLTQQQREKLDQLNQKSECDGSEC